MGSLIVRAAVVAALAVPALSTPAEAGEDKALSISLSVGPRPDMASLGSTIMQDGSFDTGSTTLADAVYGTGKALMSDRDNATLAENSANTDSALNMLSEYETGGSMLGLEVGGDVRYELDAVLDFPLFFEVGFYYSQRIVGGQQSRTFGDVATANELLGAVIAASGEDPNAFVGGTMVTNWDASWIEVPLSLGIKVPVKRGQTFAYGSFGVSWYSGGFSLAMDIDENYANVLATHIDSSATPLPTVTNYSPGAVEDMANFKATAIGLNYGVGVQTGLGKGLALFVELNSSGAAATVFTEPLQPETQQLLTALTSEGMTEADSDWFGALAYPVIFGGATARIGLRYYIF